MSIVHSIEDFKRDYQHIVVSEPYSCLRIGIAERLINSHYAHIKPECVEWVYKTQGLKLFF